MKKLIRKTAMWLLVIILITFGVEIMLGIAFMVKDRNIEPMRVADYPYLYYMFKEEPGLNKHGFKTELATEKTEGTYRVILIGGSVARGNQPEHSIAAYLQQYWNEKYDTANVEVINAGVSAFVLEQEFILTQTILQQYQPDMIIGLDGYNDLMTFKLNRFQPSAHPLPPHNWKDFQVIRYNRFKNKPYGRFGLFFNNINRVKDYSIRNIKESKFDWAAIPTETTDNVSNTYYQITTDIHDFCQAKGISYYQFIQPIRFYPDDVSSEENKGLNKLYNSMESQATTLPYVYSLAGIFSNSKALYTDDCHVNTTGNQMFAKAILDSLHL